MVMQAIPSQQMVTGSDILNQYFLQAQLAQAMALAEADATGTYNGNPTLAAQQLALQRQLGLGGLGVQQQQLGLDRELGFGNLALGRDQLNAAIAEAQRQYQLDLQRFGLDVANFNYNQRLGDATVRLQQLGLLSSLTGPKDYLKYNYMMNAMSAPQGQQADPFQLTAGLNQQYTAPPPPNIPQPPPTTMYDKQMKSGTSSTSGTQPGGQSGQQAPTGPQNALPQSPQTGVTPYYQNTYTLSGTGNADLDRLLGIMADTNARIAAQQGGQPEPQPKTMTYADGGMHPGGMAIVGDQKSGKPTGHEEMVVAPGPFMVLPHDVIKGSEMMQHMGDMGQMSHMFDGGIVHPDHAAFGGFFNGQFNGQFPGNWMDWLRNGPPNWQSRFPGQTSWMDMLMNGYRRPAPEATTQPATPPGQGTQQPRRNNYDYQLFQDGYSVGYQYPQGYTPPTHAQQPPAPPQQSYGGGMGHPASYWRAQENQPQSAATGGAFAGQDFLNNVTYGPQDTTNAPFVQQTLGNMPSPGFQGRGQPLGPFGAAPFSFTNYMSLLPSAQQMLQGYIETPTAMGGLGGNFQDELERARRAAATGISFSPAQYSR